MTTLVRTGDRHPLVPCRRTWDETIAPMSKITRKTFPVTVTQLPVVRCQVCGRTIANRHASAGDTLTDHYRREHPELLGAKN